MNDPNSLHWKAANAVEQAREIRERYDDDVPADAARQIDRLLSQASTYRKQLERDKALAEWAEPQYKHPNFDTAPAGGFSVAGAAQAGLYDGKHGQAEQSTKAFLEFARKGLDALPREMKAQLVEDSTGQSVVPSDYAGTILRELPRLGVIRNLATVRPTNSNKVDVGAVTIGSAVWAKLETAQGSADTTGAGLGATPASKQTITVWDMQALVLLGRDELEDSDGNLEEIIRSGVAAVFSEKEDDAYASGAGDASFQPFGITTSTTNPITQTIAAAANNTPTPDDLKKLPFLVSSRFRRNGVYLWHSAVEQAVALMKDNNGNYLLQPAAKAGEPSTFSGYRTYTVDGLPAPTATGTATDKSVVFGDIANGFLICDRRGLVVQRLVEKYSDVGKIGLQFTMRVGADVVRPKALAAYLL